MEKFTRVMRGYDPDEVNNFLDQVIRRVEKMIADIDKKNKLIENQNEEIKNLKASIEQTSAMKEKLEQYERMENTLNRAIMMAQKTSDQLKISAHRESEIIIDDAKKNASRIVNDALMKAEKIENVKIGGKTYSVGYRFPLKGTGQLVGVKFKASIMPMSPSARVYIDYNSSVLVLSYDETTVSAPTQNQDTPTTSKSTEPASSSSATTTSPLNTETKTDTNQIDNTLVQSENISDTQALSENIFETSALSEWEENESTTHIQTEETKGNTGLIAGIVVAVIIIAGAVAIIVIKTRIKK